MDPISVVGLIASLTQLTTSILATLSFLNTVKNGPKDCAQLIIESASLLILLTKMKSRLEDCQEQSPWFSTIKLLGEENGPLEQIDAAFDQLTKTFDQGHGLGKLKMALAWPLKKKEATEILARIERCKTLIGLALQEDITELILAIKSDTKGIPSLDEQVTSLGATLRSFEESQRVEKRLAEKERATRAQKEIVSWISPLNFIRTQDQTLKKRATGTAEWLLSSTEFTTWVAEPGQILHCEGIPGSGKTIFTSVVVETLRTKFEKNNDVGIAVVYCSYKEQQFQTIVNLLAAIWRQLSRNTASLSNDVKLIYQTHQERDTQLSVWEAEKILQAEVQRLSQVFIVIDALDECPDERRSHLIRSLRKVSRRANLMFTSRPIETIKTIIGDCLSLEVEASPQDVAKFVRSRITTEDRLSRYIRDDPSLEELIVSRLSLNSKKMFLLATLHINALSQKMTRRALDIALEKLPKELDETYDEAVARIEAQSEDERALAHNIISWICFANRPLKQAEMLHALAIDADHTEFDERNVPEPEFLTAVCAGLIIIDSITDTIVPIHYTTQEYFERIQDRLYPNGKYQVARDCLTYLSYNIFTQIEGNQDPTPSIHLRNTYEIMFRQYALYEYSVTSWLDHVTALKNKQNIQSYLGSFLSKDKNLHLAITIGNRDNFFPFAERSTGLQVAAALGFDSLVEVLINLPMSRNSVNDVNSEGATALHFASRFGRTEIALYLLKNGASVDWYSNLGQTPLHFAIQSRHIQTTRVLLTHGANVWVSDSMRQNALHFACIAGDITAVELILNSRSQKAIIDSTDIHQRTPIYYAALKGWTSIVELLMQKGANASIASVTGDGYRMTKTGKITNEDTTPLHHAAVSKSPHAIVSLVRAGLDVDTVDVDGQTALEYASREHSWTGVFTLLRQGAFPDPIPLFEAVRTGDTQIATKLLEICRDIDIHRYNLVYEATKIKNVDMLRLLIKLRPQIAINRPGTHGNTALHIASGIGASEVLIVLLEAGADVEQQNDYEETALHRAADQGHPVVVRVLLEAGSNINAKDRGGDTPLHRAAWMGHQSVAKILLGDAKINVLERGGPEESMPIHSAARAGEIDVLSLLMDAMEPVHIDSCDALGRSALIWAADRGHEALVVHLLTNGHVDVNARDHSHETALHRAAANGYDNIVYLLLSHDSDKFTRNRNRELAKDQALRSGWIELASIIDHWDQDMCKRWRAGDALLAASPPKIGKSKKGRRKALVEEKWWSA